MTSMTTKEKQSFLAGVHVGVLAIAESGQGPLTAQSGTTTGREVKCG